MTAFPKSVASYEDECEAIHSWLSEDKWLDQNEFDWLSFAWNHPDSPRKRRAVFITDETIAPPFQGDLNLAILQQFQNAGIVKSRTNEDGLIEYRLVG